MSRPASPAPARPLDARVKIVLLLAVTVAIFLAPDPVPLALWAAALAGCLAIARVGIGAVLRALRPAAIAVALVFCANLVSCDGTAPVALAGPVGIGWAGAWRGASAVVRIALLVGFACAVSAATDPVDAADACVRLLRPLRGLGAPVAELGLALSLALRFIPVVSEEAARIRLAQRARGVRFDASPLAARARAWLSVLAPLIVALLRRADRLAEAMDARCYAEADAAAPPARPLAPRDLVALVGGLAAMATLVIVSRLL